jgi:hypothetical protein
VDTQLKQIFSLIIAKHFEDFRVIPHFCECLSVHFLLLLIQIPHTLYSLLLRQQLALFSFPRVLHQNVLDDITLVKV